ncbi:MAG TPA: hypothetical protein VGH98_18325 [Gemmatimonadaceae bacterium]|jgi:hypothetical protein
MPIERRPIKPLPPNFSPQNARAYRVKDGDDWHSVARLFHIETTALIDFNFNTHVPEEVNWYLRSNVGCRKATRDGKNWMFSSDASPGVIYVPLGPTSKRIVRSIATISFIDQRLYDPEDLPEVDQYSNAGPSRTRQQFLARSGYRFVNFLEVYVETNSNQQIASYGFTAESGLYYGHSFRGILPRPYPIRQTAIAIDGRSIRFTQVVGCKTVSPQTLGAREAVKTTDSILGIHPGWGGPVGVQVERLGAELGVKAAENWRVFPPIWTEVALTVSTDGSTKGELVRHSLFPSAGFYTQSGISGQEQFNYSQVSAYDARSRLNEWRKRGWGGMELSLEPAGGNPWAEPDPRLLGHDLPFRPKIPQE